MIRGEIWTVAGGLYASEPRPALLIETRVGWVTTDQLGEVERALMTFPGLAR